MSAEKLYLTAVKNVDVGIEPIKGFVNRAFVTSSCFRIDNCYDGTRMCFLLGVHIEPPPSQWAFVEVKYGVLDKDDWGVPADKWKRIDYITWLRFVDMFVGEESSFNCESLEQCRQIKCLLTTLPDGNTPAIKCDLGMNVGKTANRLSDCLVGRFLTTWQVKFPLFLLYGDRISTARELNDIAAALTDINDVAYSIKIDRHNVKKRECIDKLKGLEISLKEKEDELSELFEESADAMNILSDTYGIEIDIEERCCTKPEVEV